MTDALATFDAGAPWVMHLERAHGLIHAAARVIEEESEPSAHLEPAARRLEHGLGALYDALDGRADRLTAIGLAHGRVWEAAVHLARAGRASALGWLRGACEELVAAEERFPRVPIGRRSSALLRAGVDRPPLHAVERASLMPSFRAPKVPEPEPEEQQLALPEPTTFEALAAAAEVVRRLARERVKRRLNLPKLAPEPKEVAPAEEIPPGFAHVPPAARSEDDFIRQWARVCLEEIGMLGVQRAPLPGDDWSACQSLELRMIASIDALTALGPLAVAHIEPWAMDAPAADPMRIFAASMAGGCLEGRDALACAERVLFRFGPGDPVVAEAFAAAMKLAPNPFVPNGLRTLFASPERGCRAIAVEVLAYRGWLTRAELDALCEEEDARVFALALPAVAAARHAGLQRALDRALAHGDLDVQAAALDAMAIAAHPRAAAAARAAAAGALGERALVRLAIVAGDEDARWLVDRMRRAPTAAAIEAAGWVGLVEAVPALIALLEAEDEEVRLAAGAALERMLGANLVQQIEVEPEAIEDVEVVDPSPEPRRGRVPLAALVSEPRDRPPAGSKDTLEVPSTEPERWRAYWTEHGERFDPKLRYRRGQQHSPSVSLYELDGLALSAEDRRRLCRELAARTGKWVRFEPHDFVADQVRSLRAWERVVRLA